MKRRPDFANLVLATEEDLDRGENYRIQTMKEIVHAMSSGYDEATSTAQYYHGIVTPQDKLRFTGTETVEITGGTFTLSTGVAFTRLNATTDLDTTPQYAGGDRAQVSAALVDANIAHQTVSDVDNYVFLVHAELQKDKRFDESGALFHFVHKEDSYLVVQLTSAECTTLGTFTGNPSGSVAVANIEAPYLDAQLTSDEKTKSFGSWSAPGGVFTIGSVTVNHYNSVFLGKIEVTDTATPKYKFYYTIPGGDPQVGNYTRERFSIVDQAHREQVGRGTPSVTNPHGLLIQDLDGHEDNNEDHRLLGHTNGIYPKSGIAALQCSVDGTSDTVDVQQLTANQYLFLGGKRITSISPTSISFSAEATGTYYIYLQPAGAPTISDSYPYEYFVGTLAKATSLPADAFALCTVYWDGSDAKAYDGDTRYSAGSATNPTTDMRVFGTTGYDTIVQDIITAAASDSVVPNGDLVLRDGDTIQGWTNGAPGTILSQTGDNCLKVTGSDSSLVFPINLLQDYSLEYLAHTEGASCDYEIKVFGYRGKNKTLDEVGSFAVKTETGVNYSSWTSVTAELLTTDVFLDDISNPVSDSLINYAAISISVTVGTLNLNNVRFRPKASTIFLGDSVVTAPKISVGAMQKRHFDGTSDTDSLEALVDGSDADAHHTHTLLNQTLGAWELKDGNTVHQAPSDGFLCGYQSNFHFTIYVHATLALVSSKDASAKRVIHGIYHSGATGTASCPVRKDEYYTHEGAFTTPSLGSYAFWFVPIG